MPEVHHLGCFEWSRHKGQAMEAGSACAYVDLSIHLCGMARSSALTCTWTLALKPSGASPDLIDTSSTVTFLPPEQEGHGMLA